jgi:hypothetical protein
MRGEFDLGLRPIYNRSLMMKRVLWTAALVSLVMVGGCAMPGAGATPEETLKNLVGALQAGDDYAVVDCFKASPAGKELLKIISSSTKALLDFSAKMTTAYGSDALKKHNFGEDRFSALITNVGEAKIVTSSDTRATATVPGWPGVIQLVKDTTTMLWRIEEPRYIDLTEAQLNSDGGFRIPRHLRDAMIMVMNEIGTPGMTADAIVAKMEVFIMAEMKKPLEPIHVPAATPEPSADPHTTTTPEPSADPHTTTRAELPGLPEPTHTTTNSRPTLPELPAPSSRVTLPPLPKPRIDLPDPAGHGRLPAPLPVHNSGNRTP